MKDVLITLLFNAVLLTTIAFDPDSASYGTQLLGAENISPYIIGAAGFIGNLLWFIGILFLIGSILVFVVSINEDLLKLEAATAKADPEKWKKWGKKRWYSASLMGISVIGAVFALGSGFWFFGLTWALLLVVTPTYTKEREILRAKLDAEELLTT